MSASHSHHQKISASPGAEMLEDRLSRRVSGTLTSPPAVERLSPSAPVESRKRDHTPTAGTQQAGHPDPKSAGGLLPLVDAQLWDCSGIRPDFYTANCPTCRSTIKVVLGAVAICKCGTPFFAQAAA